MASKFINFHTHFADSAADVLAIQNIHQNDRDKFFPENFEFCSVGLHPWFLEKNRVADDFFWLENALKKPNVVAVGEAGLDKMIDVDFDFQIEIFRRQVEISERLQKPMILHCVRAHEVLVKLKKEIRPTQNWIFHGFEKHPNTAKMCLDAGCFLSFGAAIFREKSHAADSLAATPTGRFFLETDDKSLKIKVVYARAAEIRGVNLEDLKIEIERSFGDLSTF